MYKVLFVIALFTVVSCGNNDTVEKPGQYPRNEEDFTKNVRSSDALSPEEERLTFSLPPGFDVQLYASEPLIGKPMNIDFDAAGRLWVTQSFDYPEAAESGTGSDRVTVLEDRDHDGKAEVATVFVDSLNIPIGILPTNKGAIAYSIPNIFSFADNNNDLKAEGRSTLFGPFGYQDTHGMVNNFVRGYDGWIYACHGFSNKSSVAGKQGDSIHMESGNTFRFKMDGSVVEQTTFGRVNPFGLVFDEWGYLYSTDCHSSPLYQLIHGAEYPHFGKVKEGIGFAPVMKPHEKESTALSGIAYYGSTEFPAEYRSNLFIGDVITGKVNRNSFYFEGSTPVAKKEDDFLVSSDPWFRPVSIKLGPDGALYVADFYNRIIGHYEVPLEHPGRDKVRGRIWRITYKGTTTKPTDLTKANLGQLIQKLGDQNIVVRMAAADQITDRFGKNVVKELSSLWQRNSSSDSARLVHVLWILHQTGNLSDDILRTASSHSNPMVRVHALKIINEQGSAEKFHQQLSAALGDASPHVRRAAIETAGTLQRKETVDEILASLQQVSDTDTHLNYTGKLMLRNLLRQPGILATIKNKEWNEDETKILVEVLTGVPSADAAAFLVKHIGKTFHTDNASSSEVLRHIARYDRSGKVHNMITLVRNETRSQPSLEHQHFNAILQGLKQAGAKEPAMLESWGKDIARRIVRKYHGLPVQVEQPVTYNRKEIDEQRVAFELVGKLRIAELEPELFKCLQTNITNVVIHSSAIRALMHISPEKNAPAIKRFLLSGNPPLELKRQASDVMGQFDHPHARDILSNMLDTSESLQLRVSLALANSAAGRDYLLKLMGDNKLDKKIMVRRFKQVFLMNASKEQSEKFGVLVKDITATDSLRNELIQTRLKAFDEAPGQSEAGRQVFVKNCSACHQAGGVGGVVGPQLTGIGNWGSYALAEKILDPNRNISKAFVTYSIKTKDGNLLTGLFRREDGKEKVFASVAGEEFSVSVDNIEKMEASGFTLMPDNFGNALSGQEFNSLLSYLLTLK